MIKAGLEMACFTTHVRLRTLPDSMKTLGLPNIDAMASAKNKNKGITSQYTIGPKCVSQYTYESCIWTNIIAESFYYVNYGLSIIPWKVSQIIWVKWKRIFEISYFWKHQFLNFHYWEYLTNFWRNNWRSIIDVVETSVIVSTNTIDQTIFISLLDLKLV